MIITIARECGSGGHAIAEQLAKDLNLELYDKKRMIEDAKNMGKYDENTNFLDETPINSLLYSLAAGYGEDNLQERAFDLVEKMTKGKDVVMVGHCSNYIFKDRDDVTSVFIHAEEGIRVKNLMKKHEISEKKAREIMKLYDERRASFQKYCTKEEWGIAKHYHLTLDAGVIGQQETVQIIEQYIQAKGR